MPEPCPQPSGPECTQTMNRRRGMCDLHYRRWQRHGTSADLRASVEQRFWDKVDKDGPIPEHRPDLGPCWVWTAFVPTRDQDGYGRFHYEGKNMPAHRYSILREGEEIPEGYEPDHLCRNRACVRRSHLEIVTRRVNTQRAAILRRGRAIGMAAINAAKTRCPKGHEYTAENTLVYRGARTCLTCYPRKWMTA